MRRLRTDIARADVSSSTNEATWLLAGHGVGAGDRGCALTISFDGDSSIFTGDGRTASSFNGDVRPARVASASPGRCAADSAAAASTAGFVDAARTGCPPGLLALDVDAASAVASRRCDCIVWYAQSA